MTERRRVLLLIQIMTVSSLLISGIAIAILYHTAFESRKDQLVVSAKARAAPARRSNRTGSQGGRPIRLYVCFKAQEMTSWQVKAS
jgi:hypothetical protein